MLFDRVVILEAGGYSVRKSFLGHMDIIIGGCLSARDPSMNQRIMLWCIRFTSITWLPYSFAFAPCNNESCLQAAAYRAERGPIVKF